MSNELLKNVSYVFLLLGIFMILSMSYIVSACPDANLIYYRYDNNSEFGESNSFVYDYTGTGHNAIMYNITDYVIGYIDNAVCFNDSYQYTSTIDTDELSFTNGTTDLPFSIAAWIKSDSFDNVVICSKGYYDYDPYEYKLYCGASGRLNLFLYDDGNSVNKAGYTRTSLNNFINEYVFITVTYDANNIKMYFNNVPMYTIQLTPIGYVCMNNTDNNFTTGQPTIFSNQICIDEFQLFDFLLTTDDINAIYNSYFNEDFTVLFLNNNAFSQKNNLSVYENNKFIGVYQYGDSIPIKNTYDYTFVIHENVLDSIAHVENYNGLMRENIGSIVGIIIIFMIIGLIIYFVRR